LNQVGVYDIYRSWLGCLCAFSVPLQSSKDSFYFFLGRGFIVLTGKSNYTQLGNAWNRALKIAKNFHKQTTEGGHIDEVKKTLVTLILIVSKKV
jgi:hypothetical protein